MYTKDASTAVAALLKGIALWANEIFDGEAGPRLLQLTPEAFKALAADDAALPDTSHSEAGRLLPELARFAWEGSWYSNDVSLSEALTDLSPLNEALNTSFINAFGEPLLPDNACTMIGRIVSAAHARFSLHQGEEIDIQALAALARVSEKTVRMAANPKLEGHLKTESGPGNRTWIPAEAALEWLRNRKDFMTTRFDVGVGEQPAIRTIDELAFACRLFRVRAGLEIPDLRKQLKWKAAEAMAYQNLENGVLRPNSAIFTIGGLLELSRAIGMVDPVKFCTDATRVVITTSGKLLIAQRLAELESRQ